jgi:hypothetical protein
MSYPTWGPQPGRGLFLGDGNSSLGNRNRHGMILMVIGMLTSGVAASSYVCRDGLCVRAPCRAKEPARSGLADQNWHLCFCFCM